MPLDLTNQLQSVPSDHTSVVCGHTFLLHLLFIASSLAIRRLADMEFPYGFEEMLKKEKLYDEVGCIGAPSLVKLVLFCPAYQCGGDLK